MQNTQHSMIVNEVVNKIWISMNQHRDGFSLYAIFPHVLTLLYSFHKGYNPFFPDDELHDDMLLYDLLENSYPNTIPPRFTEQFIDDLIHNKITKDVFDSIYVDLLRGLFDLISCKHSRETADFYTPSAITKLMAHIVHQEECKKIFDPFCGTASIIHELSKLDTSHTFTGREINRRISLFARLIAEAIYGNDDCISNDNSILDWSYKSYDAVVSCPPFGLRLTTSQIYDAVENTEYNCRSINDIVIGRSFDINKAKMTITLLPTSFCFKGGCDYETRREYLERNLIDTIIALPDHILYGTNVPSILLICKSGRQTDDPIKFIHAEEYYIGDRHNRVFDAGRCIDMMDSFGKDCIKVSLDEICKYDFNLNPSLYVNQEFDLTDSQQLVQLRDLITLIHGEHISPDKVEEVPDRSCLSKNFIDILLAKSKLSKPTEIRRNENYRHYEASDKKYLLSFSAGAEPKYGLFTEGKSFDCPAHIKVFEINESLVSPEYLAYILSNHKAINKSHMALSMFSSFPIVIDSLENQNKLVNKETQCYNQEVVLGLQKVIDQMKADYINEVRNRKHDMKTPMTQLRNSLTLIKELVSEIPTEYASRLDKYVSRQQKAMDVLSEIVSHIADEDEFANPEIVDIESILKSFETVTDSYAIDYHRDDTSLAEAGIETPYLKIGKVDFIRLTQNIVSNAVKRGFIKHNVEYSLNITLSVDNDFFVIDFSNNGEPLPDGMDKVRYGTKGAKGVNSDGSGRGGYIVKNITQHYGGDFDIFSTKIANMYFTNVIVKLPIYRKEDE